MRRVAREILGGACLLAALAGCDDGISEGEADLGAVGGAGGAIGGEGGAIGGEGGADMAGGVVGEADAAIGGAGGEPVGGAPVGGEGGAPVGGEPMGGGEPAPPPEVGELPRFAMPILPAERALIRAQFIIGVDHASPPSNVRTECTNYEGRLFPGCYAGHEGTDFILAGGLRQMDDGSAQVVVAAGGEVIETADGNYDRCHADLTTYDVSCDGHPIRPNYVAVRHANGWITWYYHLKSGSVLVEAGDMLPCGAPIGLIGSSGYSAMPHLHFQVEDPDGDVWDPYAGPDSQPESLWVTQETEEGLPGEACDPAWGQIPE